MSEVVFRQRLWRYTSEDSTYCPLCHEIFSIWLVGLKPFLVLGELWELLDCLVHCFLVVLYPSLKSVTLCKHRSVLGKRLKRNSLLWGILPHKFQLHSPCHTLICIFSTRWDSGSLAVLPLPVLRWESFSRQEILAYLIHFRSIRDHSPILFALLCLKAVLDIFCLVF